MWQKQRLKGGPLQGFDLVPGSVVEQVSKIQEMTVCLTDDHLEHFVQLSEVVLRLTSDFGLCSSSVSDKTAKHGP